MTRDRITHTQLNETIITNIFHLMEYRKWTIKTLSEESKIPYETLKKFLNYKISNPSFSKIVRIASALDCTPDYLMNLNAEDVSTIDNLPSHSRTRIQYLSNFRTIEGNLNEKSMPHMIPIYTPSSNHNFELHSDYDRLDLLDVSDYNFTNSSINFAIRVTGNLYHPVYFDNDILLCSNDRAPRFGEVGIFLHKNRIYIRQYLPDKNYVLAPINGIGYPIVLTTLDDWLICGYVIAVDEHV